MRLILTQPQLRAYDTEYTLQSLRRALEPFRGACDEDDIILLPEHAAFHGDAEQYFDSIAAIAAEWSCHVVGGSHHEIRADTAVNSGAATTPDGHRLARYEKLRPYSEERKRVAPGTALGEFSIGNLRVMVLICADFWFSDLFFRAKNLPDLVLVPALSVTRKSAPDYSRDIWRHMAVSRAYEFGVYVGISDWGHPSELPRLITSGVGGFADPTGLDPNSFYTPVGDKDAAMYEIDLEALERFRKDRRERGFFWKE